MSRATMIVLLTVGVFGQLFTLWLRQAVYQLTAAQRSALWTTKLTLVSALLAGGISLLTKRFQPYLDLILVASMVISVVFNFWLRRVHVATPYKPNFQSTWSPFQSAELREICTHLNQTEQARLVQNARERGRLIGQWFAVPVAMIGVLLFLSWRLGLSLLALFTVYFMLWLLPRFRAMRRRSIELLCETEWARGQNYTPSQVRIMTFPWSK